jgi:hypothetical protein
MPTYRLLTGDRDTISLKAANPITGKFEPLPKGNTYSLTNSDPASLNAIMGIDHAGGPALVINTLGGPAENIQVTVSDSSGLTPVTLMVDIVPSPPPRRLDLDVANAVHAPQAEPMPLEPADPNAADGAAIDGNAGLSATAVDFNEAVAIFESTLAADAQRTENAS